jgi:hypothetical protein
MKQSHKNCQDTHCKLCLEEHLALGGALERLTGDDKSDHLGKFHRWLGNKGIEPETEYGWGTEAYFDNDLIREYVNDCLEKG